MASPVRRVLGEKDPNTPLSPIKSALAKPLDAKPVGTPVLDASAFKSAEESKKRPLEDAALSTPPELDASATHATKRPKQLSPTTTQSLGPQKPHIETPDLQQKPTRHDPSAKEATSTATLPAAHAQQSQSESEVLEQASSQAATLADSVAETSFAETLRLRLRMAMYKVKTDQVSAPMSRLEIGSSAPTTPKDTLQIKDPPEDALRAYRRISGSSHRMRSQLLRQRLVSEQGPVVQYAPYDMALPSRSEEDELPQASYARSSSPPCSDCGVPDERARAGHHAPATPASATIDRTAFSSPESFDRPVLESGIARGLDRDVTSSAVKGSAADSLLRLGGL